MKTQREVVSKIVLIFLSGIAATQVAGCARIWNSPQAPAKVSSVRLPEEPVSHRVAKGETLFAIAKKYSGDGKNWTDIAAYNPGLKPALIKPGNVILIPPTMVASRELGAARSDSDARFMLNQPEQKVARSAKSSSKNTSEKTTLGRYEATLPEQTASLPKAKASAQKQSAKQSSNPASRMIRPAQRQVILMDLPELDANAASPDQAPVLKRQKPPASVASSSSSFSKSAASTKTASEEMELAGAQTPEVKRAPAAAVQPQPRRTDAPPPLVAKRLDLSGETASAPAKETLASAQELPRPRNLVPPQPSKGDDHSTRSSFYSCSAERCTRRTF